MYSQSLSLKHLRVLCMRTHGQAGRIMSSEQPVNKPLTGKRILVTRSQHQAGELCAKLEDRGAEVIAVPVTQIEEPPDWTEPDEAIERLDSYDWIIFASSNAAQFFAQRCRQLNKMQQLKHVRTAAIGPSTSACLNRFGVVTQFVPSQATAEQFVIEFPLHNNVSRKNILWPRGNLGRMVLKDELEALGASVHAIECYRNAAPAEQFAVAQKLASLLTENDISHALFLSGRSAMSFAVLASAGLSGEAFKGAIALDPEHLRLLSPHVKDVVIASIGPETSKICQEVLGRVDVEAKEHTIDGLIDAIIAAV
jgi:uroporphyrinogen-III synthase